MTQGYRKPRPVKDRIWEKVSFTGTCWVWMGAVTGTHRDHGSFLTGSRTDGSRRVVPVHRVVYEMYVGPIPEGFHVHHSGNAHLTLGKEISEILQRAGIEFVRVTTTAEGILLTPYREPELPEWARNGDETA